MIKFLLTLIQKTKILSGIAPILVKLTGKSKEEIHPKHLINLESPWFLSGLDKNSVVLDIGCGNGQFALKTAPYCQEIIGIERDKVQLKIAQREKKRLGLFNIKFKYADLEKRLNFTDSSFDAIIFLDVLEHLNNRIQVLKECKRVLKKNGLLFISIPNKDTSWKKRLKNSGLFYYADHDHKIEYNIPGIKKELSAGGFQIIDIKPIIYDSPLIGFIDLIGGLSLALYSKITSWRISQVLKKPKETTGFRIVCKPLAL